jgi:DNA-binding response OmpR family regulator
MSAGLNALACCSLTDLDRYAAAVQMDAVVLDLSLSTPAETGRLLRRWQAMALVTCAVQAPHAASTAQVEGPDARASIKPDLLFSMPLSCDGIALELAAALRRTPVPEDLRATDAEVPAVTAAEASSGAGLVYLDGRWCQLHVRSPDQEVGTVELTALEYRLAHALLSAPGRVWSRETLLTVLQQGGGDVQALRSVDQSIRRLRDRLCELRLDGALLTVRGQGYTWVLPSAR